MLNFIYNRSLVARIIFSLLIAVGALALQMSLHTYINESIFLFLYPAVFLISWMAGFIPATFSILLSTFAVYNFYYHSAYIRPALLHLLIYAVTSLTLAWIIKYTRKRERTFQDTVQKTSGQLFSILENMQDAFCVVDKDWNIVYVNRNHESVTLIKREDQLGKKLWHVFPDGAHESSTYWIEFNKVKTTGIASEFEDYYGPLNIWTEVRANLTDEGGIAIFYRDITLRKNSEQTISQNEKRFRALADSMPQIVFISNKLGQVSYMNKQWNEYTGISLKDFGKLNLADVIHQDDFRHFIDKWKQSLRNERKLYIECRLRKSDGTYRWHLVRSNPIKNHKGKTESWFGTSTDIHDLRSAQEALKSNEEKFETMANNIPQLSWMSDGEGWVFWYNQRWFDYTGTSNEEMQGWAWEKVHHPDHVVRVTQGFKRHLINGRPWEDIYPIRGKDGQYRWFLTRATPIRNKEGKIVRWFGTNTDIDEQVKIEAMLNESHLHFRQLANSIPHIVWTSSADGHLDFYNERFYEFTGIIEGQEFKKDHPQIIHPEDFERTKKQWQNSVRTGVPYQIEYRLKDHFNHYRWFLGLALPVRDNLGEIIKWFGSCTEINHQKLLSETIELQKNELENALRARDEFLSIASHELKTPLTSLRLHTQMFKKGISKGKADAYAPEKIDSLSTQVEKQVSKLNRLVDDMLDISRIRTGKLTLRPQEFDLCELVYEVFETLREQFASSNCPLPIFSCNKDEIKVRWDRVRIEQVLINLLTNSIRYGNGKQASLELSIHEDRAWLKLKDNGIGIAPENLEKIFFRFEKIKNPEEVAGLGLGLYITKQIIEAHGGKIWVESQLGIGSEFKIQLPL